MGAPAAPAGGASRAPRRATRPAERVRALAEEISPWATKVRRALHANPELSFQEFETSRLIASELERAQIPYGRVGETGLVAFVRGRLASAVPPLAIRADMDALPVHEQNDCPFRSTSGRMHACGHDMHAAMVLSSAVLLATKLSDAVGEVRVIFQPAEEIGRGADVMVSSGLLDGTGAVVGLHMDPQAPVGTVETGPGPRTSMGRWAHVEFEGAHAISSSLDLVRLVERRQAALVTAGPHTLVPTVLRSSSTPAGHLSRVVYDGRVFHSEDGEALDRVVRRAVSEIAGDEARFHVESGPIGGVVNNDPGLTRLACDALAATLGARSVVRTGPVMFGEDFFAYGSLGARLLFSLLGGRVGDEGHPLHSSRVQFSEQAIPVGITYFLSIALAYFASCGERT